MPLGRPRHNAENKSSRLQASRKPRSSVFVAVTVPGSTPQASTSTATPTQPEPDAVTESSGANAQTPAISNFECAHNPLIAEAEALPSLFLDEGVLGGQSADTVVDYDPDFGFPNDDAEAMDLAYGQNQEDLFKSLDLYIDPVFQRQALSGSFRDVANRSLEPSLSSSRILAELAHLNGGIAQQLTYMDSLVHSQPSQHLTPSCVDKVDNRQFNPLPGALESTAALVTIIKQIISPIQDQGPSPATTPVVLMCLSGYIQLLQIFNAMFCHLHRLLRGLSDISSFFENLPEFASISGLPAVQGDLYIKVAIQVVQHNVSSLEKAIGLPPELCLSPQRAPSKSLLSHMESPDWFWGLMNQACSPAEKSANALVSSLRTEIGNVLGLVNI
jgi:hypothetical protein